MGWTSSISGGPSYIFYFKFYIVPYPRNKYVTEYPLEAIEALLDFAGIPEVTKTVGDNGEMKYELGTGGVVGYLNNNENRYFIQYKELHNQNIIFIAEPDGIMTEFHPYANWHDAMYIIPIIHNILHKYQNACTTHNQHVVANKLHDKLIEIEDGIIIHYSIEHTWSQLNNLSTAILGTRKYLPFLNS